jgi:uncharacterized membrane protein YdbT with pleckstrin-like domain
MKTEIKPNVSRIIIGSIFGYLIIFAICIGLFIGANMFVNFLNTAGATESYLFNFNLLKYFIYGILTLILVSSIFSFVNLIGNTLTTKYTINENYVTRKTTFLNEIEEDVPIKQITNIDYTISWFWDKIFGTGSLAIYTSGSTGADMYFYGINSVTDIYDNIKSKIDSFRKDIIKQKKTKLIKSVKPNVAIAVLLTTFGTIGIYGFLSIYLIGALGPLLLDNLLNGILIIIVLLFITATFSAMEYKKKQYDFYTDKLEYYDGFLTFHKVSVPIERITNIELIRTLFDRIFGVSKIKVETAGSGASEIYIKYVTDGETIVSELKEVLKENGRN